MRLAEILRECESRGVRLAVKPSGLSVRGALTPELRKELRRHKFNILQHLRTGNCHHELEPKVCAVCSGRVRKMIKQEES